MAILDGFGSLDRKLQFVAKELSGRNATQRLKAVGKATVPDVEVAIGRTPATKGSLADLSMSGWTKRDGSAIVLSGAYEVLTESQLEMRPGLRSGNWRLGAGPMRVLESGRSSYAMGDRRTAGTYRSKKTGEVRQRTRRVKRATGATGGKGTWTDAVSIMSAEMTARWHAEYIRSMGGLF